ncbi:MAG: hypothetical protein SGI72_05275 [Planctomycetota bacterium]|nr:hypothetical protein [Planctomycetota bacterium]
MRFHSILLPAFAIVVALGAGSRPQFAPAAATTLKKHITNENKSRTTKVEFTVDGEAQGEAPEGFELTFEGNDDFLIVDEYVKSADGRPTELKRTFEELSTKNLQGNGNSEDEPQEIIKESELTSKVVVFKWDDKKDEYTTAFDDGKGDDELLADLDADLDFLGFLPGKDVKEGDEWEVDGSKARLILYPGGDLKLEAKDKDDTGKEINKELRESIKGKLTLTHKGLKEEGDTQLLVFEVKGDLDASGDSESEDGGTTTIHVSLVITGEIVWDATHNHVHSVSIEAEDKTLYAINADVDIEGENHTIARKFHFEGTQKFKVELEK